MACTWNLFENLLLNSIRHYLCILNLLLYSCTSTECFIHINSSSILFTEDNVNMSVLHFINQKTVEIVYKDYLDIWKGCHVLHDFVEMITFDAKKTLLDFFEKYPLEYYEFLQEVKTKISRIYIATMLKIKYKDIACLA